MTVEHRASDTKRRLAPIVVAFVFLFLLLSTFPLIANGLETPAESPEVGRAMHAASVLQSETMLITKTAPITVTAGDLVTYTISWLVSGTVPVDNVAITDRVPVGTTFWEASQPTASEPAQGATGVVTWSLGTVTPGPGSPEQGVVTLTVLASGSLVSGTLISNTSWLSTTPAWISDTAETRIEEEPGPPPAPTLSITKTAPVTVTAGDLVTYTISWLVSGTVPVDNVAVTDRVPIETTFWEASQPTTVEPALGETGVVTWSLNTVAPTLGNPEQGVLTLTVLTRDLLISGTLSRTRPG